MNLASNSVNRAAVPPSTVQDIIIAVREIIRFHRSLFAVLVVLLLIGAPLRTNAQQACDLEFGYQVEAGVGSGKIYLTLRSGEGPFTIRLYDLNAGGNAFLQTKEFDRLTPGTRFLAFSDVPAGSYLIRAESPKCKRSLTGLDPIVIP
jgi:hypothetical protein